MNFESLGIYSGQKNSRIQRGLLSRVHLIGSRSALWASDYIRAYTGIAGFDRDFVVYWINEALRERILTVNIIFPCKQQIIVYGRPLNYKIHTTFRRAHGGIYLLLYHTRYLQTIRYFLLFVRLMRVIQRGAFVSSAILTDKIRQQPTPGLKITKAVNYTSIQLTGLDINEQTITRHEHYGIEILLKKGILKANSQQIVLFLYVTYSVINHAV